MVNKLVSVVVPVYNEETVIEKFYNELITVFENLKYYNLELIFVEDESTDKTLDIVKDISRKDPRVKAISLSRNFGHQISLVAGMDNAQGDVVISMDGDLQHPPEVIPDLLKKWEEGYEVVTTEKNSIEVVPFFKRILTNLFYFFIQMISEYPVKKHTADFRLLDRKVVTILSSLTEKNRFIRGLIGWIGFKQISILYNVNPRFAGQSKYSLKRMFKLAFDGIFAFSILPLRMAIFFGFLFILFSFIYAIVLIILYFNHQIPIAGWTTTILIILLVGGVQLVLMGLNGEYIGRIYAEVKNRPLYIVREKVGFHKESSHESMD